MYSAYILSDDTVEQLVKRFPPKFKDFIGHHVTISSGVPKDTPVPEPANLRVIGYVSNNTNLETLIVSVNGSIQRPDGKTFHITWSLNRDEGVKPVDSNDLIRFKQFTLIRPIHINADPAVL